MRMRSDEEVPHIRIGVRTLGLAQFAAMRKFFTRSVENDKQIEATVEVLQYPAECEICITEQGVIYDVCPDAFQIRTTHQEMKDPYALSMRVRREVKEYMSRVTE